MEFAFIGAGKVGTSFGWYLKNKDFNVAGFYSKNHVSALKAADYTSTEAYDDLHILTKSANIIFITTPDDMIENICNSLVEKKLLTKNHIICHMSGALSSQILNSANKIGCATYSLHPLQAFADIPKASQKLKNTFFSLEGSSEKMAVMQKILKQMGNKYFVIKSADKVLYHSAACVFSNYLVSLLNLGLELMDTAGIKKEESLQAVMPLILGTLDNVTSFSPKKALTGPLARGDIKTLTKHLSSIKGKCPQYLDFYKNLSLETLNLAQKEKLKDQQKIHDLKILLGGK